ncbi:ribosomal L4/L1 family protein [Anaplasma phagocytophilum str. ApNP]|uniref:Large ribosomal subunit protein uL4 n=1 Tax=Anaplasma phagocytophilum str. ApNP TaxID=1359153 RepID=A0A0F3NEB4_ANAPH|nr:ribosomal L4/L1 family protein [Anaplasma phagocytophilum str. ApNP]
MEVNIVNIANEVVGSIDLNPQVFGLEPRRDVLKEVVNWQLAKRRAGTHKAKGISDISGTTAKPYRQKHTGRARQGSLRSPQFRVVR